MAWITGTLTINKTPGRQKEPQQLTAGHQQGRAQGRSRQQGSASRYVLQRQLRTQQRQLRAFRANGRGSIAIMGAVSLALLVVCTAFAIDEGMLYLERRSAQGAIDLAAIAGAADLDNAREAALLSLAANGITSVDRLVVTRGQYVPDAAVEPDKRFVAHVEPANAVRLTLQFAGGVYFAKAFGFAAPDIGVSATAAQTSAATFSIGSRLARFEGGILNNVLSALTGSSVQLSAVDYQALVDADVQLFDVMSALASEANVTAGTYNDLLDGTLSVGDFINAMATATSSSGQAHAAVSALNTLSSGVATAGITVPLNHVVNLGHLGHLSVGQTSPGLGSSIGLMEVVTAGLMAANGQSAVAVDLGATIPGLLDVEMKIAIGEPPQHSGWINVGATGQVLRTSQARLQLDARIGGSGGLLGSVLHVPVFVEAAYGEAKLSEVECAEAAGGDHRVAIDARSGAVEAWIGEATNSSFGDWSHPAVIEKAHILTLPLVTASSHMEIGSSNYEKLTFTGSEIGSSMPKTTTTDSLAGSLTNSLIADMRLKTGLLGLSVTNPLKGTIEAILSGAAEPLDGVILTVFETLGIKLGEADVWVHGVRCDGAVLVQ